jgi:uncharacterized protein YegP (UPF0339 family)
MREFVVPKTDTKVLGKVQLEYAFQLHARYDAPHLSKTPKGEFRYQDITSGDVRGERLTATVYPDSGGQYDTVRADHVRDVDAHFILKAENGEWIYFEHVGYRRKDGYYRAIAYIDADTKGAYDWLNNTTFVVTAKESADEREVVFYYYLAN